MPVFPLITLGAFLLFIGTMLKIPTLGYVFLFLGSCAWIFAAIHAKIQFDNSIEKKKGAKVAAAQSQSSPTP